MTAVDERKQWAECPECKSVVYTHVLGAKWAHSIQQVCCRCGTVGPDLHYLAPEREAEEAKKQAEQQALANRDGTLLPGTQANEWGW